MMRAVEKYDVNVVGLTLSKNQTSHVQRLFRTSRRPDVPDAGCLRAGRTVRRAGGAGS